MLKVGAHSPVGEHLPSMHKALRAIPTMTNTKVVMSGGRELLVLLVSSSLREEGGSVDSGSWEKLTRCRQVKVVSLTSHERWLRAMGLECGAVCKVFRVFQGCNFCELSPKLPVLRLCLSHPRACE